MRACLLTWVFGLASAPAPEPPEPTNAGPAITWEAPSRCPDQDQFRRKVETYMGGLPGKGAQGEASVVVAREKVDFRAIIRIEQADGAGERELSAADCGALMQASAVVVAVALDPERVAQAMEAKHEPPPTPPARPAPRRPRLALRLAGGIIYGPLPDVAPVVALDVPVDLRWLRLVGALRYVPPRAATYEDGAGGRLQLVTGAVRLCATPPTAPARVAGCGGIEVGVLVARGVEVADPQSPVVAWVAAEAGPELSMRVHRLVALWFGVDMVVPVLRPAFKVGERAPVFRVPAVGARGLLGVEVQIP